MKRKTIEQINEASDFEFIFKCFQGKGYSPRGSMAMAEPYITFGDILCVLFIRHFLLKKRILVLQEILYIK